MRKFITLLISSLLFFSCTGFLNNKNNIDSQTVKIPSFVNTTTDKALKKCSTYQVGVGVADITEYPSDQINGGYVERAQKTAGIHTRQKARAFIIGDNNKRVVILVIDDWAVTLEMKEALATRLKKGLLKDKFGKEVYIFDNSGNPFYNIHNIMAIASHSHNGVMGDSQRRQYNIPAGGYDETLLNCTVNGSINAILMAHQNMQESTIEFAKETLVDNYNVTKNRSILPHLYNKSFMNLNITPKDFEKMNEEEKEKLRNHPEATDKNMYLLKFKSVKTGSDIGALNWFSIHSTSMSASNTMISGDNKAVSQQMFENMMGSNNGNENDFVAGFATSALGDVASNRIMYHKNKFGYELNMR